MRPSSRRTSLSTRRPASPSALGWPANPKIVSMPPYYDLPLAQLRAHVSDAREPDELDAFWRESIAAAYAHDLDAHFVPVASPLSVIDTFDASYAGFDGDPILGWLHLPRGADGPLPCVVEFLGYGGG